LQGQWRKFGKIVKMATEGVAKVTEENSETKENMEVDEVDETTVAEWVFWNKFMDVYSPFLIVFNHYLILSYFHSASCTGDGSLVRRVTSPNFSVQVHRFRLWARISWRFYCSSSWLHVVVQTLFEGIEWICCLNILWQLVPFIDDNLAEKFLSACLADVLFIDLLAVTTEKRTLLKPR